MYMMIYRYYRRKIAMNHKLSKEYRKQSLHNERKLRSTYMLLDVQRSTKKNRDGTYLPFQRAKRIGVDGSDLITTHRGS
jgi:hypothetical protein